MNLTEGEKPAGGREREIVCTGQETMRARATWWIASEKRAEGESNGEIQMGGYLIQNNIVILPP